MSGGVGKDLELDGFIEEEGDFGSDVQRRCASIEAKRTRQKAPLLDGLRESIKQG